MNDYRVHFKLNEESQVYPIEFFKKVSAFDFNDAEDRLLDEIPEAKIIHTELLTKPQERKNVDYIDAYHGPSYGSECAEV